MDKMNFMSNADFCEQRSEIFQEILALKAMRRVALGPDMTVMFESPRLIWWQIQEILRVEQGGAAQLAEECEVYGPLFPTEDFITLTMMIEIDDPVARKKALTKCLGIERQLFLEGAGFRIASEPMDMGGMPSIISDQQGAQEAGRGETIEAAGRQSPEQDVGYNENEEKPVEKTSSVHFLRFPLNQSTHNALALGEPVLSCQHPQSLYRTPIATPLWNALCHDVGIVPLKY